MNILLTIAARAGSKGVKNKNIRPLLGKPLIAHTIQQAREWGRAKHVIVSTDSLEIAEVARHYGAEVPFRRPDILATDAAGKLAVIQHALLESEKVFGETYDVIADLDVTAPLRKIRDIENGWKKFCDEGAEVLFSVVKSHKNPYFNMVELNSCGKPELSKKLLVPVIRRQDAPQVYSLNASIYFYKRDYLLKKNPMLFESDCTIYEMDPFSAFDIDSETDFQFVEFILERGLL